MTDSLYDLKQDAREALLESLQWNIDTDKYEDYHDLKRGIEISDLIFETADQMVPIYFSELLDLAADDNDLALNEPELGPAFDGTNCPINIIAANVFEALESDLWEYWRELEDSDDLVFPVSEEEDSDYNDQDLFIRFLYALKAEIDDQPIMVQSWIDSMKRVAANLYRISFD